MKFPKFLICAVGILALALPAFAQTLPTGTLSGHVDDGKQALPGVMVSVASPNLQGTRTAATSVNGDYIFAFLPPGDYTVKFDLQGYQTIETGVKISAAQRSSVNATMPAVKVAEEVTVTGSYETISTSGQAASTLTNDLLNKLPLAANAGTIGNYAALAAGTNRSSVSGELAISGAMSYENLFLVNGVAIMDNVRNTPTNFYVEDAVQETTTSTASISAEYGRFAGGVVNMLTKSGGNDFHGSFRVGLDNDKWAAATPLTVARTDKISETYSATLGGFIFKDHLWFFGAYRSRKTDVTQQTSYTNLPYPVGTKDTRYEGKLTFSVNANHRLVGSYLDYDVLQNNNYYTSATIMDLRSLYNRELPSKLYTGNYTGVLTDNFFVEAQYSKKEFAFVGSGSPWRDPINGTLMIDRSRNSRFWSPTFCGVCEPEKRNNEEIIAKASYFLSSQGFGTHDIVGGYDTFDDQRSVMNHQSGNDTRIYTQSAVIGPGGEVFPVMLPGTSTYFYWQPILNYNKGNHFKTDSLFLNDKWRLNDKFSFNIGVRYDKNNGKDGMGKLVADDSKISPRLGVTWDPKANGEWLVNAGFALYVSALANTRGDATSSAGNPATWQYNYGGPAINDKCTTAGVNCTDTATAIQEFWNWFQANGVDPFASPWTDNPKLYRGAPDIPGGNSKFVGSLKSPNTQEITVGFAKRFGSRGTFRIDYVNRQQKDFYVSRLDLSTGVVTTPNGTFNWTVYENNSNLLERTYDGLQMQWSFRLGDAFNVGGNWTISRLYGNWDGENTTSGPLASGILSFPEYLNVAWYAPKGDLGADQRHKARAWAVWDAISQGHNRLSISLMESFFSGTPYGAVGTVPLTDAAKKPYLANPGYVSTPPTTQTYYFTRRDAFHQDSVTTTDLSANYTFVIPALGTNLEFFVQPVVTNILNEHAVASSTGINTTVYTAGDKSYLARFNPFTATPTECPQGQTTTCSGNWQKGPSFGQPTNANAYQTPRTITISLGVRF
jgi:outer membrane receptor protein involved in Fe transport